ncbi:MAG TPA: ABC transporter permease [Gemmatimonadales bacterium]|jgi:predicted permease
MNDVRYAFRTLARNPGFTAVAVLTLALGIGASTAVFSVVEGVLLRSLPFPGAERLVDVKSRHGTASFQEYDAWRSAPGVFDDAGAAVFEDPVLKVDRGAERVGTWVVTANFLPLLGVRPLLGRAFFSEEDLPGAARVAALSYDFWQSRFGGDPHVLGRALTLDTASYTIVGVLPPNLTNPAGFKHRGDADVWLALGSFRSRPAAVQWLSRPGFWVIGRLRPGVTSAQAERSLDATTRGLTSEAGRAAFVTPLHEYLVVRVRTALLVILAAAGLLVLVACANVATLLLCRAVSREHEVALRVALGASRPRLLRQVLTESVLLALGGGALGILVAVWALPGLIRLAGPELPAIADIGVNVRVLVAALVASVAAGLAAGLAPALRAARQAPGKGLRAASGAAEGHAWRHRSSDALIVAQVALTMVLLSGAGILMRSFMRLVRSDPGFESGRVVTAELTLSGARYAAGQARLAYVQQALERVRALPGATTAAAASGMPLAGYAIGSVDLPGRADAPGRPPAWISGVTADYFRALGIPLKRGQLFGDVGESPGVVIDEAAARAYFSGEDPLGRAITFYGSRTRTIIGVVGNTRQESLEAPPPPHIYQPLAADPAAHLKILARTSGDPARLVTSLRAAVQGVDRTVPLDRVAPLDALMAAALARHRFYTSLLGIFAVTALALAATGAYGIAAYAVTRRTQEIGVRVALGASRGAVLELILSHGLALAAIGLTLGVPAALAVTRALSAFLFEIGPRDPVALASVAVVLFVTVLVASYVPARRATRVDPMVALRYE